MLDHLRATAAAIAGKDATPADQPAIDSLIYHMLTDQDDRLGLGDTDREPARKRD